MSILRTFLNTTCPACGDPKRKNNAFCVGCYSTLPKELSKPLWKRFGEGFEEAYEEALKWLKADQAETEQLLREPE